MLTLSRFAVANYLIVSINTSGMPVHILQREYPERVLLAVAGIALRIQNGESFGFKVIGGNAYRSTHRVRGG
jgi:hypothetical protein